MTASEENSTRPVWQRRLLRGLVLYIVVPSVSVTILLFVFQRRLMYQPTTAVELPVANEKFANAKDVEITTTDNVILRGWLLRSDASAANETGWLVIYFPGNSLNRSERVSDLREVLRTGFDVLIFDYRGYGDSDGSPNEADLMADAQRVWNFATENAGYAEDKIVIFGESLGGGVALSLWDASNSNPPKPRSVILNSTFSSMTDTVAATYPYLPFHHLVLDRWPSVERIVRVNCPITIFHGTADRIVPFSLAEKLAAANDSARLIKIADGEHNLVPTLKLRAELKMLKRDRRL